MARTARSPRRPTGTALAAAVLVASIAVLVATPVVVLADRAQDPSPATVGDRTATTAAAAGSPLREVGAGRTAERGPRPAAVVVPALGLATSVVPAGVTDGGAVVVPDNIALVGWYRFGARPADDRGSTVIVGHRDGVDDGAGAFYGIGSLRVGDRVEIVDTAWQRTAYRVVARESFDKRAVPYDELFATDGPERLTLISCGGRFLADQGSYEDNVVVTAVPERGGIP